MTMIRGGGGLLFLLLLMVVPAVAVESNNTQGTIIFQQFMKNSFCRLPHVRSWHFHQLVYNGKATYARPPILTSVVVSQSEGQMTVLSSGDMI